MNNEIHNLYDLDIISKIKVSEKTFILKTKNDSYVLKQIENNESEKIYNQLYLLRTDTFVLPIKNENNTFSFPFEQMRYIVEEYYDEDNISSHNQKISFYIKQIASLHKATTFKINVNDSYFDNVLNYLDGEIKKVSDDINARIEVVEREDYHSPNDWYFLLNFNLLQNALDLASKHVLNFENAIKEIKKIKIGLIYENFDFSHILVRSEKIISLEKMNYNIVSYDLYNFITKQNDSKIDNITYIKEYLEINPLEEYEKEFLLALLYIFPYERKVSYLQDIDKLINLISYISKINELEEAIIFSLKEEE